MSDLIILFFQLVLLGGFVGSVGIILTILLNKMDSSVIATQLKKSH